VDQPHGDPAHVTPFTGGSDVPGKKGAKNVGSNIREFHKGKKYKKTARKFGKKRADKQAVAVGLREAGVARKKAKAKKARKKTRSRG
jgi:hypothetical protein